MILRRFLHDARRAAAWWSVGMVGLVVFTAAFYPTVKGSASFDEVFEQLPEALRAVVGVTEGVPLTSPEGYLHGRLFSTLVPVLLLVLGVGAGARAIGGSEAEGTLELLLANPVSRLRVLLERYGAAVALLAAVSGVLTLALLVLAPPFGLTEGVATARLLGAFAAAFGLALLHLSVAFAMGAVTGQKGPAVAVPSVIAAAGYLLEGLGAVSDTVRPLRAASPWHWYLERNIVADGLTPGSVAGPLALSLAVMAMAAWVFTRRDLR